MEEFYNEYVAWNDAFKDFLETQDDRWRDLLNAIEKFGAEPITEEKFAQLENTEGLGIQGQAKEFAKQLYTYIKAYTKGSAETLLLNNGLSKSFETWRSLADKGRSTREENVVQLRLRVLTPSRVSKYSELEAAISAWDKERIYFEQLRPKEVLGPELEKVCLMKICPLELAKHIQREAKRFVLPEQVREEISDWIARDDKHRSGGLLAELGLKTGEQDGQEEEGHDEETQEEIRKTVGDELFAVMVKKGLMKRSPKGKGKAPRKRFKCDAEDHVMAQCPKATPEEKQKMAEQRICQK